MGLVTHWHGEGRTVVAVLHDLDLVRKYFPRTLLLAREPIGWGATEAVLTPERPGRRGRCRSRRGTSGAMAHRGPGTPWRCAFAQRGRTIRARPLIL